MPFKNLKMVLYNFLHLANSAVHSTESKFVIVYIMSSIKYKTEDKQSVVLYSYFILFIMFQQLVVCALIALYVQVICSLQLGFYFFLTFSLFCL